MDVTLRDDRKYRKGIRTYQRALNNFDIFFFSTTRNVTWVTYTEINNMRLCFELLSLIGISTIQEKDCKSTNFVLYFSCECNRMLVCDGCTEKSLVLNP